MQRLIHANDDVNMGQSSNDVFPSAVHLAALDEIVHDLLPALAKLEAALAAKAVEFDDVVKSGRTHWMDAVPVTLGQEFSGYAAQVELGIARVEACLPRIWPLVSSIDSNGMAHVTAFVAARIVDIQTPSGGPIQVRLQPTMFSVPLALTDARRATSAYLVPNPYLARVRLVR